MDDFNKDLNKEIENPETTSPTDVPSKTEEPSLVDDTDSVDLQAEDDIFDDVSEPLNDEIEIEEEIPYFNQRINSYVPDYSFSEPRPEKVKNKGLKVFCIILAAILIVSLSVSAGYFAAVYSGAANGGAVVNVPKFELENRPENDKEIFETFSEAFSNVNESVVSIMVYSPSGSNNVGSASGVIYSKDGYIVTNDHIYENVPKAKFLVRLHNGK